MQRGGQIFRRDRDLHADRVAPGACAGDIRGERRMQPRRIGASVTGNCPQALGDVNATALQQAVDGERS
ncbi:hypothetical protein WI94_12660 [Burkholderia vietnamiensis]|nr:hypothetical protein WI94_12660 [Burkholderia vietnamiensis]KVE84032.1 hypothetical protein WJ00_20390 [Burkholderia vietnamiensis]